MPDCNEESSHAWSANPVDRSRFVSNGGNCCISSIQLNILPVPEILKNDVECLRIVEYSGEEGLAIQVSPNGVPGIVFQQNNGQSAIEHIITHSGRTACPPPLFLYGPGTEPSVMHYKRGSSTTTHVIFKPHALKTLLGINASALTDVACALNFSDQSHFIRDIKAFSGMTPTSLAQKVDDFYHDQAGYSYV